MPLVPALRKLRQVDRCEFKASLIYVDSPRTAKATGTGPVSRTTK